MDSGDGQAARLRQQRDRFVSFALAGADALLELDGDGRVAYAAGTAERLFAVPAEALAGRPFLELVTPADRRLAEELLIRLHRCGRLERVPLRLLAGSGGGAGGGSGERPALLSGLVLPERPQAVSLVLARARAADGGDDGVGEGAEAFAIAAARMVRDAARLGDDLWLSLFALPEAPGRGRPAVESVLRAWGVAGGGSIGRLGERSYAVLHDRAVPAALIAERLGTQVPALAGAGHASLDAARGELSDGEVARALGHALRLFAEGGGVGWRLATLADAHARAVEDTLARVGAFRQTLGSDTLALVFQPVVDLRAWQVHHYECFARLRQGDRLMTPARALGFAGDFGVTADLDLAVLRRVLAVVRESKVIRPQAVVSVNISARSLAHEGFSAKLLSLLEENRIIAPRLGIEVTDATVLGELEALNAVLQKVRGLGSKVALDDFGKGAIGFPHLRGLQPDFVKIDGSALGESFSTRHGKPFLKAVAALCHELDIRTIGEMVEDDRTLWLLRDAGVDFGQGYRFGKPMEDVSAFTLGAPETGTPETGAPETGAGAASRPPAPRR